MKTMTLKLTGQAKVKQDLPKDYLDKYFQLGEDETETPLRILQRSQALIKFNYIDDDSKSLITIKGLQGTYPVGILNIIKEPLDYTKSTVSSIKQLSSSDTHTKEAQGAEVTQVDETTVYDMTADTEQIKETMAAIKDGSHKDVDAIKQEITLVEKQMEELLSNLNDTKNTLMLQAEYQMKRFIKAYQQGTIKDMPGLFKDYVNNQANAKTGVEALISMYITNEDLTVYKKIEAETWEAFKASDDYNPHEVSSSDLTKQYSAKYLKDFEQYKPKLNYTLTNYVDSEVLKPFTTLSKMINDFDSKIKELFTYATTESIDSFIAEELTKVNYQEFRTTESEMHLESIKNSSFGSVLDFDYDYTTDTKKPVSRYYDIVRILQLIQEHKNNPEKLKELICENPVAWKMNRTYIAKQDFFGKIEYKFEYVGNRYFDEEYNKQIPDFITKHIKSQSIENISKSIFNYYVNHMTALYLYRSFKVDTLELADGEVFKIQLA